MYSSVSLGLATGEVAASDGGWYFLEVYSAPPDTFTDCLGVVQHGDAALFFCSADEPHVHIVLCLQVFCSENKPMCSISHTKKIFMSLSYFLVLLV